MPRGWTKSFLYPEGFMSAPHTVPAIPLPVPVKGLNRRDPLSSMDPNYAPWILNWMPEAQYIKVRAGWEIFATMTDENTVLGLASHADGSSGTGSKLFAYCQGAATNNEIYNITAGGNFVTGDAEAGGPASGTADEAYQTKYGRRTAFFTEASFANDARVFDGSTWATPGFTYGGLPVGSPVALHFKGRMFIFYADGKVYWSELGS